MFNCLFKLPYHYSQNFNELFENSFIYINQDLFVRNNLQNSFIRDRK
jgi:hypothetical protein